MPENKLKIITGQKFGKLSIVKEVAGIPIPSGQIHRAFLCKCDCGVEKVIRLGHLSAGRIISCGCRTEKHKMNGTKIYSVYHSMIQRCEAPYVSEGSKKSYQNRGIAVCELWRNSFLAFYIWAMSNGYRDGLQLDRKNNNLGYTPYNCRFVTRIVNANNKGNTVYVEVSGEKIAIMIFLDSIGFEMKYRLAVAKRIRRGWGLDDAVKTPFTSKGCTGSRNNYIEK